MILNNSKKRVVAAMSGGVDSSVAAALLVEQGYDVVGMMMRLWSEPGVGASAPANRCCTPDQMADARRVAGLLGIPFYVVDVQDHFRQTIVQFFIDEHENGRTPNPCIECNRQIRFTHLLERALALDADYLATGHYAQVAHTPTGYQLRKGLDPNKDQSYVLHVLNQEKLSKVLFPIGGYTKPEVRALAQKFGLPVASKSESQDLCFLGDGNYRRFLQEYSQQASQPGPILTSDDEELGQHNGLPFYTIGQRKGLGISSNVPMFVLRKDVARNALIVGPKSELGQQILIARDVNWIDGDPPKEPISAQIKIRYKAKAIPGEIIDLGDGRSQVTFHEPVFGVTAGQGAVFYDGDLCVGGGIIADGANDLVETATSTSSVQAVSHQTAPTLELANIQVLS
ncbi:MAG: tRNA-specific 2-thiouridylase MnmA [Ardenticatenaceae bacterium]|nr:MAG: tRNA-specific 2-thiouridylase MnmA [Ardenticatenaceae bacterium]